ncbi:uncharacterized protein Bfra_002275 [Botrytis fragariae]|uniref:Rhodopsin domain-containing protein n=1 Tax=Botrytis fragariae TaxID=1964551 RepID=A0A8H6EKT3_9HELO|nr:uncharacterized protein Bfra_002275 [Botrytis fragariae]KAF5875879.1 hypothetical protein Bfra_002275 [Botrytis fragariae]
MRGAPTETPRAVVLVVPLENLNALAWTLLSISTVLTFGCFYIRWQKGKSLHLNDIFNALALGSLLAFAITYQVYLPIQYGYQLYALGLGGYIPSDDQLMYAQNVGIVNIVFFWVTIYLVKASFLALYWALSSVSNAFRKWWLAVAIYTGISFLATFFAIFWSCKTPSHLEDVGIVFPPEACNTISEELIIGLETLWCVLNTVGDILSLPPAVTLPLGMLRAMHMPTSRKLGVAAIAGLVIIDILFDVLRTIYTEGSYTNPFPNANAVWALCEPTIAVMVCALPPYRTLLFRKKIEPSTSYQGMHGTRSTRKTKSGNTSSPHEMDDMSVYILASTRSVLGHHADVHAV